MTPRGRQKAGPPKKGLDPSPPELEEASAISHRTIDVRIECLKLSRDIAARHNLLTPATMIEFATELENYALGTTDSAPRAGKKTGKA